MNNLYIGMPRSEVIAVMGDPDRVSATESVEYLIYQLARPGEVLVFESQMTEYGVRIINGQVESYGSIEELTAR